MRGWANLMHDRLAWPILLAAVLALLLTPESAPAQFGGLAEQNAVMDMQQEVAGGKSGDRDQEDPEEEPEEPEEPEPEEPAEKRVSRSGSNWDKWNDNHSIKRSKAPFTSWWKLPLLLGAFVMWVGIGDWINRDAQLYNLGFGTWNPIYIGIGIIAFPLAVVLPFAAGLPVALLASLGPLIPYALKHNSAVEPHQKVFTKGWFRHEWAKVAGKMGIKVNTEVLADYEKGAAVDLIARGADEETKNKANLVTARQSPGYVLVKEMVAEMVRRRSDRALLDYRQDTVAVKHHIDGIWHNGESTERDSGDVMLAVMKQLANLSPQERQSKQSGEIGAKYEGSDYDLEVSSQGVKTGERVMLTLNDRTKKALRTFNDLGMREKISKQWLEALGAESGLVLVSAQPEGGLTTLCDVSLMETDRLMRDFFSIEDERHPERDIENIVVHKYDSKKGESPATILEKLIRLYPNAYVCRDFVNPESAKGLLEEVKDEKLVVTCVHAKEAAEAPLRMLQKKTPHRDFAENLTAVLNMRLIRLLCDECKVGYEPAPDLLKKLGIPEGKVTMLYRTPKPEEVNKPCEKCGAIGYSGRTGLFELLMVNDKVRQVLLKQPKLDMMRKASRAAGMRNFQEEGILLVAKGSTSLQELQRVLKG